MMSLKGKTALITGAARGIGRSMAEGLAEIGANLVLVDIDAHALTAMGVQLKAKGGQVFTRAMDVADPASAEALKVEAESHFGGVDVLVNNAAIGPESISSRYLTDRAKFWEVSDELWLAMLRVNVFGPQLMSRTFVRPMIERSWGRIVNITTSLDTMYRPGIGSYGPCKAALEAASRIMAGDVDGTGVTANVLVPGGPVNTRQVPSENGLPADKLIQPEQMRAPLIWLCSDEADQINGLRLIARRWNPQLPLERRLAEASAPVAWPQLGAQSVFPSTQP
ncbi:SDR family NAD(P)-dependent oxidoreductase [Bradyrhizobium sp. CIAT3101]|uniref:SDR family NAD(P)-dependent oxidoreductase n=1 Tax=Bradyrhizobium sp. CIAT3101 TaxID=439387 RepID=UPI0024B0892B|nr:SDR family oxidoreductase [Bradyrhizobium sp. CIAT3101]WFU79213.1 SDR family NAD(P)-dependent oxidoreductase [Bradyrhizobium sp. CIAT3101]